MEVDPNTSTSTGGVNPSASTGDASHGTVTGGGNNKRKAVEPGALDPRVPEDDEVAMNIDQVEVLVDEWVREVQACGIEEGPWEGVGVEDESMQQEAWGDVHGGDLPLEKVVAARAEEVGFMEDRGIWTLRPIKECWEVDTNKGGLASMEVRSRLVARD